MPLRILKIVLGSIFALANGWPDTIGTGTFLGFLAPADAASVGFDTAKVLIYFGCGYLIYRGFKPATNRPDRPGKEHNSGSDCEGPSASRSAKTSCRSSGVNMAEDTVQMTTEQYRKFVAFQYLNASTFLYKGLKSQQGKNDRHFVVTLRSFIEYTRRGIWLLAWATREQVSVFEKLTFQNPRSPSVARMDELINDGLGLGKVSHLLDPVEDVNNEPFLNCLHDVAF